MIDNQGWWVLRYPFSTLNNPKSLDERTFWTGVDEAGLCAFSHYMYRLATRKRTQVTGSFRKTAQARFGGCHKDRNRTRIFFDATSIIIDRGPRSFNHKLKGEKKKKLLNAQPNSEFQHTIFSATSFPACVASWTVEKAPEPSFFPRVYFPISLAHW